MIAHTDTEDAAPTRKRTYGHHPLMGFVDHRQGGTGEPVAALLRPGNTGSNTDADHFTATQLALGQMPKREPCGRRTLIHTDLAGSTHDLVAWLAQPGRWPSYSVSVGMVITDTIHQHVLKVPVSARRPAVETDGEMCDGAWGAELTGFVLDGCPRGMRLIDRQQQPYPGAQLRLTDADGMRLTCFATNTLGRPIAEFQLRHRLQAQAEDSIRDARAVGLRNLCLHRTAQNQIWLGIMQIAPDLPTANSPHGPALAWSSHITAALERLALLPNPAEQRIPVSATAAQRSKQWNPAPPRGDTRALDLHSLRPRLENGPSTPSADRHETASLRDFPQ